MKTQPADKNRSQRGQSLVEVAISLTFLLLLLSGAIDLGRMFFYYIAIRDAAQEGATFGSLAPYDLAGIEHRVRVSSDHPLDLTDPNSVHVDVHFPGGTCGGNGNGVQVTVTYNFDLTMPLIGAVIGSQHFPLNATVNNTILRPPCPPSP